MKFNFILFSVLLAVLISCSKTDKEEPTAPLSEQSLKFEIYDSLVVDYLGNLLLMDISPDGKNYLMIDQNTDTIFVTNPEGEVKYKYYRNGDDPQAIPGNRAGLGKFLDNQTILIPGTRGLASYSISGSLNDSYQPDFTGATNLVVPFNQIHDVVGSQVYLYLPGRYGDSGSQGIEFQKKSTRLEILDLNSAEFEPSIPFPAESKYSSETQAFGSIDYYPTFKIVGDSLFIFFRNEPKLFTYHLSNLDSPSNVKIIPYQEFIERKLEDKPSNGSFNLRDFFLGINLSLFPTEDNEFLIQYLSGLTDEVANEVISAGGSDFEKIFEEAEKYNTGGFVLFDGTQLSPLIDQPEILGTLNKYVSKDEIWFSLNFAEAENDYSVIYKTRLVNK